MCLSDDDHCLNNLVDQLYQRCFPAKYTRLSGDVVGSGIGLYYYLRVMVVMYMTSPDTPRIDADAHWGTKVGGIMVLGAALLVLLLGIYPDPMINLALKSEILSPLNFMLSQQQ